MKAKRLRALLVAGLLSLAPAVTLTSCGGGGGGGGGGGSDTSSSDVPVAQDDHALASNLVGKSVVFSLGSDQTTINFNAANTVTGTMIDRNSTSSAPSSLQGTYTNPIVASQGGHALGKVTVYMNSLTSGKQQGFQITYKVESGVFSIHEAIWKIGSTTANVTQYCYFSK